MQSLLKKAPTIALIAIFATSAFFAYGFFSRPALAQDLTVTGPSGGNSLIDPASEAVLQQINSIDFNTSIFSNPTFLSLQNYVTPLPVETPGRANPFAPFSGLKGSSQ